MKLFKSRRGVARSVLLKTGPGEKVRSIQYINSLEGTDTFAAILAVVTIPRRRMRTLSQMMVTVLNLMKIPQHQTR